jgi:hypothetical protein
MVCPGVKSRELVKRSGPSGEEEKTSVCDCDCDRETSQSQGMHVCASMQSPIKDDMSQRFPHVSISFRLCVCVVLVSLSFRHKSLFQAAHVCYVKRGNVTKTPQRFPVSFSFRLCVYAMSSEGVSERLM